MTDREKLARDIYLAIIPSLGAPSYDEVEKYVEMTASYSVMAADKLIKALNND